MSVSSPTFDSQEGLQVDWLLDHHRTKEPERRQMVAALDLQPGDRVLDSACGPGLWARMFAEKVFPTGKVVGLDLSAGFLDYARASLAADPLGDIIEFVEGDFHDPRVPEEGFDVVFLGNCLSYLAEADAMSVLDRHKELVRPGGRVVSKEFDGATVIFHPLSPALTLKVVSVAALKLEKTPSRPIFDNFVGRKTHGMLRRSGFRNVTTRSYAIQKVTPLSAEAKRYITGNALWYGEQAGDLLSAEEHARWEQAFEPGRGEYILDRPDFYFCMVETVTVGTV